MKDIDIQAFNREAWNRQVSLGNRWTIPVQPETIAAARQGNWTIYLTPNIPVPRDWFPAPVNGKQVLCLASGGGQQGPVLAAAGARVTVFDNSPAQLQRDREVSQREGLSIQTIEGDMRDLSVFSDEYFELIVHPISNNFVPEVRPVWQEAYRVLRPGGTLLSGFGNPIIYIFDWDMIDAEQRLEVRFPLPYSDLAAHNQETLQKFAAEGRSLEFSHSLENQIGGQIEAGFLIAGLYEDRNPEDQPELLDQYLPIYIATRAIKPA